MPAADGLGALQGQDEGRVRALRAGRAEALPLRALLPAGTSDPSARFCRPHHGHQMRSLASPTPLRVVSRTSRTNASFRLLAFSGGMAEGEGGGGGTGWGPVDNVS